MRRFAMILLVAVLVSGFSFTALAARPTFDLTISVSGNGTTDPAPGVHTYYKNQEATITAIPDSGYVLDHWEGAASGSANPVTVVMNSNKSVTAVFVEESTPTTYTLTMAVSGSGTTTPAVGPHTYNENDVVNVSANADTGWDFDHWEGALTGSANPDSVTMDADKTVTAVFVESTPTTYTLTMAVSGSGTTTPAVGPHTYNENDVVAVSANADTGWDFDHWEGALTGSANPDSVTMDADKTVTAVFVEQGGYDPAQVLANYVATPDPNYSWTQYHSSGGFGYTNYFIDMTSVQWRDASEVDRPIWQHYLIIQKGWFTGSTAIMLIDGGSNGGTPPTEADDAIGLMSMLSGFPIADLKQIPNEPLYFTDEPGVKRSEDSLLAYGFNKFMVTDDPLWNGHLPMAKASVYGMDTIQAKLGCNKFVVTGASKRGWTTWLVAATDDPRIIGYIPIVIPILNCDEQMIHHWESYGFYSFAVSPYLEWDLFCVLDTVQGQKWLQIEDPYCYLDTSSTIANEPKLLVNAAGDEFFMPDALQFYWDDIPGPGQKSVRILPNASHAMEQGSAFDDALATAVAWAGNVKNNDPNPAYSWSVDGNGAITVTCGSSPSSVVMWQGTNPNARDFRVYSDDGVVGFGENWTSSPLYDQGGNTFVGYCDPPAQGWTAYYVQVDFGSDHVYTSEIVVTPSTLPYAGTACL